MLIGECLFDSAIGNAFQNMNNSTVSATPEKLKHSHFIKKTLRDSKSHLPKAPNGGALTPMWTSVSTSPREDRVSGSAVSTLPLRGPGCGPA